jgi:hypothetical protein
VADDQYNRTPETAEAKRERQANAAREGAQAMAEYQAEIVAVRERTAKLRALRLAREASGAGKASPKEMKPAAKAARPAVKAAKAAPKSAKRAGKKTVRKAASR